MTERKETVDTNLPKARRIAGRMRELTEEMANHKVGTTKYKDLTAELKYRKGELIDLGYPHATRDPELALEKSFEPMV